MKTVARPELRERVAAFADKLAAGPEAIPLTEFAALFGAGDEVLAHVATRGDLRFRGDVFSNDGPEMVLPAGSVELEIPSLLRGTWEASPGGFALRFGHADFTLRACAKVAVFRKCFDLREIRASASEMVLDFGNALADRRYTF